MKNTLLVCTHLAERCSGFADTVVNEKYRLYSLDADLIVYKPEPFPKHMIPDSSAIWSAERERFSAAFEKNLVTVSDGNTLPNTITSVGIADSVVGVEIETYLGVRRGSNTRIYGYVSALLTLSEGSVPAWMLKPLPAGRTVPLRTVQISSARPAHWMAVCFSDVLGREAESMTRVYASHELNAAAAETQLEVATWKVALQSVLTYGIIEASRKNI